MHRQPGDLAVRGKAAEAVGGGEDHVAAGPGHDRPGGGAPAEPELFVGAAAVAVAADPVLVGKGDENFVVLGGGPGPAQGEVSRLAVKRLHDHFVLVRRGETQESDRAPARVQEPEAGPRPFQQHRVGSQVRAGHLVAEHGEGAPGIPHAEEQQLPRQHRHRFPPATGFVRRDQGQRPALSLQAQGGHDLRMGGVPGVSGYVEEMQAFVFLGLQIAQEADAVRPGRPAADLGAGPVAVRLEVHFLPAIRVQPMDRFALTVPPEQ